MKAETVSREEEFDPHSVENISQGDWERTLAKFTEDMDPWSIDIVKLADRYKSYIERMEDFDLELPGRVIMVGAVLLRMKAEVLRQEEEGEVGEDFEEQVEYEEEFIEEEEEGRQLKIPEAVPKPPVKKKGKRKVTLDELKDALDRAMDIQERRSRRQEERREEEDFGVEVEEEDITDRLESMYSSLKSYIGGGDDAVTFSNLVEQEERREKIEKFVNLMHLETEERVQCYQEEWLGEIEIEVLEE
ncbi:MAG: segregation/condensation protein A [Candidatus Nanohaloarchaea archaeon]|nr:segregation/condensation protein A [Candidatus Nanohaloarchaea archaeon]